MKDLALALENRLGALAEMGEALGRAAPLGAFEQDAAIPLRHGGRSCPLAFGFSFPS